MLQSYEVKIKEVQKNAQDIPALLKEYALQDAYLFWENHQKASLLPYSEFTWPQGWEQQTMRFVLFTENMEIRLEKDAQSSIFYGRILQELGAKGLFTAKDDAFILRKTSSIDAKVFSQGRILNREYFEPDADGMLVFVADRLALAKEGR